MLSRDDVLRGLKQLAERLDADGINVAIHLVGGAAVMLTVRPDRQLTADVDSWVNSRGDEQLRTRVIEAVMLVGRANPGFPDDWLNDNASMFIPDNVSGELSGWDPLLTVGGVTIVVAPPEVLLAMKLLAGRGRRDIPDLPPLVAACGVTTVREVEGIFDRYYPHDDMKPSARRWLTEFSGLS